MEIETSPTTIHINGDHHHKILKDIDDEKLNNNHVTQIMINGSVRDEDMMTPPSVNGAHHAHPIKPVRTTSKKKRAAPDAPAIVINVKPADAYLDGPDQIVPSENGYACEANGAVKIKMENEGVGAKKPMSVVTLLDKAAVKYPNRAALCEKKNDVWIKTSFKSYRDQVRTVAKAFIKLGLERFHSVCILGFNSPEWFISDLAAIHAGGFAAGIYTTNTAEACFYCAENSRANIIVVEDQKQLDKILQVKSRLPDLKAIIQYKGTPTAEGVLSWNDVMEIGKKESDDELNERIKRIACNQCCTLVYTSGTTGNPKGVMLTHDNLTWDAISIGSCIDIVPAWEIIVSYLPLSHVAAQVVDLYVTITYGVTVYFAQPDALKGSLLSTLTDVRPTKFLGVPRVWEKIYEKMSDIARQNTGIKKTIATWAKRHGLQHTMNLMNGNDRTTWNYYFANKIVLSKIKAALGLDRCNLFVSAAAPISQEVVKYFMSLDIPLMECYGMSEGSGGHSLDVPTAFRLESVGKTLPGMKTMIFEPDEKKNGEICMYGRHVFMGYLNEEKKTKECLDDDGWLHSGDIGRLDNDGFIFITGRLKELLITAGGENVAPVPIEDAVKAELSIVSNAMLIGDRRKFLTILITLRTESNLDTGEPVDKLTSGAKAWLKDIGCEAKTLSELIDTPNEKVMKAIEDGINRYNKQAESNAKKIQKFRILPKDFSIPGGELGPTMKVKRNVVHEKYSEIIESMYA